MVEIKPIHSYLMSNFYTPGIILSTENIMIIQSRYESCSQELTFSYKIEIIMKYINRYISSSVICSKKPM